jgi:hypothetical protein
LAGQRGVRDWLATKHDPLIMKPGTSWATIEGHVRTDVAEPHTRSSSDEPTWRGRTSRLVQHVGQTRLRAAR